MQQQWSQCIIGFGCHPELGYTHIKCRIDWLTSSQSLVEADAEADRRSVTHGLPHADNAGNYRCQRLGKPFCVACIDDNALDVTADRFKCLYEPIHGYDVCRSDIILSRETSLPATTMPGEVNKVRLEIDQSLSDVTGTYSPLSLD